MLGFFKPKLATEDELVSAGITELENWNKTRYPIIKFRGKLWFVKRMSSKAMNREVLASELAKGVANVPDVLVASEKLLKYINKLGCLDPDDDTNSTLLVRAGQTMAITELPNKTLDAATAAELVFSLWIRRRDVDVWNRTYTQDYIPVFYDLNACLDFEDELFDVDSFFRNDRYGYGGSWRVKEINHTQDKSELLSDTALRRNKDHNSYIDSTENFLQEIDIAKNAIKNIEISRINLYIEAGYEEKEAKNIRKYLEETSESLDADVETMKTVIFSSKKPRPGISKL